MQPTRPAGTTVAASMGLRPTSMAWSSAASSNHDICKTAQSRIDTRRIFAKNGSGRGFHALPVGEAGLGGVPRRTSRAIAGPRGV